MDTLKFQNVAAPYDVTFSMSAECHIFGVHTQGAMTPKFECG